MSANVWLDGQSIAVQPHDRSREVEFERFLLNNQSGSLWLPEPTQLDERLMSLFLGTVAIEALANRRSGIEG